MKRFIAGCAAIILMYIPALAQEKMSAEERVEFVGFFQKDCFKTQRADPGNASLSEDTLVHYCACMSGEIADRLTRAEAYAGPAGTPDAQAKYSAAQKACFKEVYAGPGQERSLEEARAGWVSALRQGCLNGYEKDKGQVSRANATNYCECTSVETGKRMTPEMAAHMPSLTPELRVLMEAAIKNCSGKVSKQ